MFHLKLSISNADTLYSVKQQISGHFSKTDYLFLTWLYKCQDRLSTCYIAVENYITDIFDLDEDVRGYLNYPACRKHEHYVN